MKLDYFDLLSPEPIYFRYIGGVRSPTLREISQLSYSTYQMYLSLLLMTPESYHSIIPENISEEETSSPHIFDLITKNDSLCQSAEAMLNFFLVNTVKYSSAHQAFLLFDKKEDTEPSGAIQKDLWLPLCDIILQRNYIRQQTEDLSNIKSPKAQAIMKKLQTGRKLHEKQRQSDSNLELGNIISAVANKSHSLTIVTIWDLTIYQLWDTFYRICNNSIYEIQSISVAAYGDKNHSFDSNSWFKNLMNSKETNSR